MSGFIKRIVIVGGGSAGWLVAGILAAANRHAGLRITLVESPQVKTLGVGEGTWPTMRDTLRKMGISEQRFLSTCDASYKQGTEFRHWRRSAGADRYHHPFSLPVGYYDSELVRYWHNLDQESAEPAAFADGFSPQPYLSEAGYAPKQLATPDYAAVNNYGYHLNAGLFAELLQQHCTEQLAVEHRIAHIQSVTTDDSGAITALQTSAGEQIAAELFIDCSGFSARLIGEHYGVPFLDQKNTLFNDTALAVQVPYADPLAAIASTTRSTAQRVGWIWDIGLQSRRGIGLVYSSAHLSDDDAEHQLRQYLQETAPHFSLEAVAKKISIRPGFRQQAWIQNCVAIGTSAGFTEPLEASSLVMIELAAAMLADRLPASVEDMALLRARFNERYRAQWDRTIDFLKLHYVLSKRTDSAYWHDNRAPGSIPDSLQQLLAIWRHHPPSRYDFPRVDELFPTASFQYILYGMGYPTQATHALTSEQSRLVEQQRELVSQQKRKMAALLPDNRSLLMQQRASAQLATMPYAKPQPA